MAQSIDCTLTASHLVVPTVIQWSAHVCQPQSILMVLFIRIGVGQRTCVLFIRCALRVLIVYEFYIDQQLTMKDFTDNPRRRSNNRRRGSNGSDGDYDRNNQYMKLQGDHGVGYDFSVRVTGNGACRGKGYGSHDGNALKYLQGNSFGSLGGHGRNRNGGSGGYRGGSGSGPRRESSAYGSREDRGANSAGGSYEDRSQQGDDHRGDRRYERSGYENRQTPQPNQETQKNDSRGHSDHQPYYQDAPRDDMRGNGLSQEAGGYGSSGTDRNYGVEVWRGRFDFAPRRESYGDREGRGSNSGSGSFEDRSRQVNGEWGQIQKDHRDGSTRYEERRQTAQMDNDSRRQADHQPYYQDAPRDNMRGDQSRGDGTSNRRYGDDKGSFRQQDGTGQRGNLPVEQYTYERDGNYETNSGSRRARSGYENQGHSGETQKTDDWTRDQEYSSERRSGDQQNHNGRQERCQADTGNQNEWMNFNVSHAFDNLGTSNRQYGSGGDEANSGSRPALSGYENQDHSGETRKTDDRTQDQKYSFERRNGNQQDHNDRQKRYLADDGDLNEWAKFDVFPDSDDFPVEIRRPNEHGRQSSSQQFPSHHDEENRSRGHDDHRDYRDDRRMSSERRVDERRNDSNRGNTHAKDYDDNDASRRYDESRHFENRSIQDRDHHNDSNNETDHGQTSSNTIVVYNQKSPRFLSTFAVSTFSGAESSDDDETEIRERANPYIRTFQERDQGCQTDSLLEETMKKLKVSKYAKKAYLFEYSAGYESDGALMENNNRRPNPLRCRKVRKSRKNNWMGDEFYNATLRRIHILNDQDPAVRFLKLLGILNEPAVQNVVLRLYSHQHDFRCYKFAALLNLQSQARRGDHLHYLSPILAAVHEVTRTLRPSPRATLYMVSVIMNQGFFEIVRYLVESQWSGEVARIDRSRLFETIAGMELD